MEGATAFKHFPEILSTPAFELERQHKSLEALLLDIRAKLERLALDGFIKFSNLILGSTNEFAKFGPILAKCAFKVPL